MPFKKFKIQLPIKEYNPKPVASVVQNDINSNMFEITLTENGKPYPIDDAWIVSFTVRKEDETISVGRASIIDAAKGRIQYILTDQCVAVPGVCRGTIDVYKKEETKVVAREIEVAPGQFQTEYETIVINPDQRVTSAMFTYRVREDLFSEDAIESAPEYPLVLALKNIIVSDQRPRDYLDGKDGDIWVKYIPRTD